MKYFELIDDMTFPGRWHLGEVWCGSRAVSDSLTDARPWEDGSVVVDIDDDGQRMDFTLTNFAVPVTTQALADELQRVAQTCIQFIPASVRGSPGGYCVVNPTRAIDCVDETASEFLKWTAHDHRADLAGQYRQVTRLRIDAARVNPSIHMFRISGWLVSLVVSEVVKNLIDNGPTTGATFLPVF